MKSRFSKYATAFIAYLLFVILFGAWVRITHSGAGCGSHWPTCNGDVIPFEPSTQTIIEYTHRLTSGLLGILGIVFVGWAYKRHRTGRVFLAAVVTLTLIMFEALIGAGLVLRELVADDASVARAVVISLHLANTLVLTAAATLTTWWDGTDRAMHWGRRRRLEILGVVALLFIVATCMSGAVTALGDTLFPVDPNAGPLLARLRADGSAASHFLVRLRVVHPILAVVGASFVGGLAYAVRARGINDQTDRWASVVVFAVITQVALGVISIALAAPGWMQLAHLLTAQLVWIATVVLVVSVVSAE